MTDLLLPDDPYLSVTALTTAYDDADLRPSDVVRALLDRISRLDARIGAFQAIYADEAMRCAEAADKMFASGVRIGPLHGVPFLLKDICDVAGRKTTGGSAAMADRVPAATGTLAQRLMAAGAIMLGKTKTVECALGGWGTNQHMGTPWNPWDMDTHRVPGGSSSGTGAGIAAGFAPCGVGTDTGGSVRLPAGFCGLVGLKVTEGRLPTDGIIPLSRTLDTPGPLARSVADALIMFLVMDGAEGWAIDRDRRQGTGLFAALGQGVSGLRLGVLDDAERAACSADVLNAYDAALDTMAGLGARLYPFSPPLSYAVMAAECGRLIVAEAYANHRHLYDRHDLPLDTDVRDRMLQGRGIPAADYLQMLADRQARKASFLSAMQGLDALLTPTMTETAPALDEIDQARSPGHFTRPCNDLGLCALSVPSGLAPSGLPTSLQIVARPDDEAMALRIGAAWEAARPALIYPDLA